MANLADNFLSGVSSGASLAQHIEQVQQARQKFEEQKKAQFISKTNFITSKLREGLLLPKAVQSGYFKNLRAQAEQLSIPIDESSIQIMQDPDFRNAALSSLSHVFGLPDDQKSQAGVQMLAFLGGDVGGLQKELLGVKEAMTHAATANAKAAAAGNTNGFKQANMNDKVVREVSNYGPVKTLASNIAAGSAALANIAKDPQHVLFRDYKEAVIEVNKMLTQSAVLPMGREEGLEFKSAATKGQQFIDRFKGSESDYIDPREAKLTIDRLGRLVHKSQATHDMLIKKQLTARVAAGVIDKSLADSLFTQLSVGAEPAAVAASGGAKFSSAQDAILAKRGIKPGTPEYAAKLAAYQAKSQAAAPPAEESGAGNPPASGGAPAEPSPTPEAETPTPGTGAENGNGEENPSPEAAQPDASADPNALSVEPVAPGEDQ